MPASKQGLSLIATDIRNANITVNFYEEAWDEEAISCEHCTGAGDDGLECSHPKQEEDPFCHSGNCPLIEELGGYNNG